jgi:hypothetical protein
MANRPATSIPIVSQERITGTYYRALEDFRLIPPIEPTLVILMSFRRNEVDYLFLQRRRSYMQIIAVLKQ